MSKIVSKSARKLTKALFASCQPEALPGIADTLEALSQAWSNDPMVASFFGNPAVILDNKRQVLNALLAELNNPKEFKNFANILLDNSKLNLIPEIALEFRSLYNHFLKSLELSITTASDLSHDEKEEVVSYLKKNFGSTVQVEWQSNPEIIGGFVVKSGDQLLDSSISGALEKIKISLLS